MALNELKKINSDDSDLMKLQENTRSFTSQLNKVILDGVIIKNVLIGTTTTLIPTTIARAYQGWEVLDLQGNAVVWRDTTDQSDNKKFLPLISSSPVTVTLWVF